MYRLLWNVFLNRDRKLGVDGGRNRFKKIWESRKKDDKD